MKINIPVRTKGWYTPGELWLPADKSPVVITSHGVSKPEEENGRYLFGVKYLALKDSLNNVGLGCFLFPHADRGVEERLEELENARRTLQREIGTQNFGLFGSSYGGTVVRVFAYLSEHPYKALVTWNALGPNPTNNIDAAVMSNRMIAEAVEKGIPKIPWLIVYGENDYEKEGRAGGRTEKERLETLLESYPSRLERDISFHAVLNGDHGLEAEEHLVDAVSVTTRHFKKYLLR